MKYGHRVPIPSFIYFKSPLFAAVYFFGNALAESFSISVFAYRDISVLFAERGRKLALGNIISYKNEVSIFFTGFGASSDGGNTASFTAANSTPRTLLRCRLPMQRQTVFVQ